MDKLCNTSILSTENFLFTSFYYCGRRAEGRLYVPRFRVYSESCGSGSLRAERSGDQEALGRNGPRVRKPSGGMIRGSGNLKAERSGTRKPSGGTVQGPGSLRVEWSKDQETLRRNGPGRGVRSVLRSTLHGPRVRALGASFFARVLGGSLRRAIRRAPPGGLSARSGT